MQKVTALILAAGEGKRMKSKKSKVLHEIIDKPIIEYVYDSLMGAKIDDILCIVGHKAEEVKESIGNKFIYFLQEEQLGTGHAVMQARKYISEKSESVLILCGDAPLIRESSIEQVKNFYSDNNYDVVLITADIDDPKGYGRIIRDSEGNVKKIIEHKDANNDELKIKEVNSGMYIFKSKYLLDALDRLNNNNVQQEYYLTDTIEILINKGCRIGAYKISDSTEILGINNKIQLSDATEIIKNRNNEKHMLNGVTIVDLNSTYIGSSVEIGMDTIIKPGCVIEGKTKIGEDCVIGPNTTISSSKIGNNTEVNNSVLNDSDIGESTNVGPFAYLRPKSKIGNKVKIGDFVEIKASEIGDKTKISHLSYIGDAVVGRNVNIGCGVVVVNYNGKEKRVTHIGDNAFVGCNANLISPVNVEKNTYIAAGSTITDDVPENSLAIARSRQVLKEDWIINKDMKREEK